jgi:hypothetical protein
MTRSRRIAAALVVAVLGFEYAGPGGTWFNAGT